MIVLGLTGPTGGGKGALAKAFFANGIPVFDADAVYHSIVDRPSACVKALAEVFGDFILSADGSLNRKVLAKHVFCGGEEQKSRIKTLTSITHPFVLDECYGWIKDQKAKGHPFALIDAPLLCESGLDAKCDKVITVLAPVEARLARIMLRDRIDEAAARARIAAQPPHEYYAKHADFVVINDADEAALAQKAKEILEQLS